MSEQIRIGDWRIETITDRSCLDCILAADDDHMGGIMINRQDKMMSIYNYVIISEAECIAEGEHV